MSTLGRTLANAFLIMLCASCGERGTAIDGGTASVDAASMTDDAPRPPEHCVRPTGAALDDVTSSPASPYFVHHPSAAGGGVLHTVLFLPGGPGSRPLAQATWDAWLSSPSRADDMRVIVPYSARGDFPSESERAIAILDEVLACHGGDPAHLHLGGTSLGGLAAYALFADHPARFATLLGAPGLWERGVTSRVLEAVRGKAVFNGIGELEDEPWASEVRGVDERLREEGIDSRLVVFEGEGHILSEEFDETIFYDFWAAH